MALIKIRSGNKVGWEYYDSEAEAREAAEKARAEAARKLGLGYDFGYCFPGTVAETADGLWEVCIP